MDSKRPQLCVPPEENMFTINISEIKMHNLHGIGCEASAHLALVPVIVSIEEADLGHLDAPTHRRPEDGKVPGKVDDETNLRSRWEQEFLSRAVWPSRAELRMTRLGKNPL